MRDKHINDLIIIGASGFGREVAWLVERINALRPTWNLLGFMDDNPNAQGTVVGGYPVLGDCNAAATYPDSYFVCAVGAAQTRRKIVGRLNGIMTPNYATLIDPSALISNRVKVGVGCMICAGSIITVDIDIGNHVIVNLDCTIGHDSVIRDFVTVYPSVNISGSTDIGEAVELGTGTQVIQGKSIGEETIIGAGAVVVKNLPSKCTAVGSPAKPIKFHEE